MKPFTNWLQETAGEGSIEKTALHGLLGAMTSKAAGSSALAGILSGGVQEYAMGYLHNHMPKAGQQTIPMKHR